MRLIDHKAAQDAIEKHILEMRDEYGSFDVIDAVAVALSTVPTIDPVKLGRWAPIEDKYIDVCKCSECGAVEYFNKGWKKFNFCPNCGAKMEAE